MAGIFADDGISGTNTKKREEFNRMIDECSRAIEGCASGASHCTHPKTTACKIIS